MAPNNFFRSVQFNIGNRNYQIGNYKDANQLEFPAGIFTLVSDESAFGDMANLIEHHRIWDVNEVVCTHNKNTDVDIWLREQQYMLYLMAQINCESQAQANEVVHQIKRFVSTGKYIQLFPYSSFQQIPSYFFDAKLNNPDKHDIENLYMKYVPETGEVNYFFQIHYKPIFKFNSINAELSDNSARSFPVVCDISYLIQMPMWLFDTYDEKKVTRINLGVMTNDSISSIIADNNFLEENDYPFTINGIRYTVGERYIIDPTSPNYHDGVIVIPISNSGAGNNDFISGGVGDNEGDLTHRPEDYVVQIAKLYPKKSTVISWIDSHRGLPKEITKDNLRYWLGFKDLETKILDTNEYDVVTNEKTRAREIIIYSKDKPHLTPDLDSPVIATFLTPVPNEQVEIQKKRKNMFLNVYKIREQKAWKSE